MRGTQVKKIKKELIEKYGMEKWVDYIENNGTRINRGLGGLYRKMKHKRKIKC